MKQPAREPRWLVWRGAKKGTGDGGDRPLVAYLRNQATGSWPEHLLPETGSRRSCSVGTVFLLWHEVFCPSGGDGFWLVRLFPAI